MKKFMIALLAVTVLQPCLAQEHQKQRRSIPTMMVLRNSLMAGVQQTCSCAAKFRLIESWDDKSTWKIDYPEGTPAAQVAAGNAFIASFNVPDPAK